MESSTEFEGKNVEEALERACEALGVSASEVRYEVVEDGRKGFLGIGTRPVRIRILSERDPGARGPGGAQGQAPTHVPESGYIDDDAESQNKFLNRAERSGPVGGSGGGRGGARGGQGRGGGGSKGPRGGRGGDHNRQMHHGVHPGGTRPHGRNDDLPIGAGIPAGAPYSSEEAVRLVAGRILREMGLELRARLRERDGAIVLELGGTDSTLLLENEGEVIEALQHLLNKILSRDERFESRVVVDCEGFRSRHDEATVERARAAADEALRTGKPVQLEGLNPYERRLAHLALAENKAIRTYSTGDGAMRTLNVEPASAAADEA